MTPATTGSSEDQIRALLDERVRAIHDKDAQALVSACAPDIVSFDALPPLQRLGAEAVRDRAKEWLGWYDGPVGYEIRDLHITAGDDTAFASYLYRVTGTMTNGSTVDMWVRSTICLRKIGGDWLIAHEHTSVPFDAESGRATFDLTP
jgi:ketosteroid isomerase-like protein